MMRKLIAATFLSFWASVSFAQTPGTVDECLEAWDEAVRGVTSFSATLKRGWDFAEKRPDKSITAFLEIQNWPSHRVDLTQCPKLLSLSDDSLPEMTELLSDYYDMAECGRIVSLMSMSNHKWYKNRDAWLAGDRDADGNLKVTDADMGGYAAQILRRSGEVLRMDQCYYNAPAMDWALATNRWAENILRDPKFN